MPIVDYSNRPEPTAAEKQRFNEIVQQNLSRETSTRHQQQKLDMTIIALGCLVAVVLLIALGPRLMRGAKEVLLNSAAKGVRAKRFANDRLDKVKQDILTRADDK